MGYLLVLFFLGIPAALTICNVLALFKKTLFKPSLHNVIDILTFALGVSFTALLIAMSDFHHWDEQIYRLQEYSPISFDALPTFLTLCLIAIASYVALRWFGKKLSPIVASLCFAGLFIGFCLTVLLTVQLYSYPFSVTGILLLLFPYNYVLCSVRLIREAAAQHAEKFAQNSYKNKLLQWCQRYLCSAGSFMLFSFVLSVPLLLATMILLLLFGQQPDSMIKMFTDTAEWTLSQKIPPPRLDYAGHYLCTVAACGDEKVVKPLRAGRRRNTLIVVNRQLLVANAFEDLLAEKTPRLHKIIRKTYDRVGLPISRYITTKRRSNAVYWLMKPLEWLFVTVLYTFDTDPENRIHSQYTK